MSDEAWTVGRLLTWTTDWLGAKGSESPRLDAEVLLAHVRGCPRIALYTAFDTPVAEAVRGRFRELVKRRGEGEPVAVALGGGAGFEWSGRDYRFRAEWNVQPRDATREGPDWLAWSHAGLPLGPFPGDGRQTFRASADAQWLGETRLPVRLHLAHLRLHPLPGSAPGEPAPEPAPLPVPGLALTGHLTEATLSFHPGGPAFNKTRRDAFSPWGSPAFTLWAMGGQPVPLGNPDQRNPVTLGWQIAFQLYVPLP
jgi:hypothetical protein